MAGLRPYIFGRPDACNRLHAPRRGGALVGLLSLPGRCRTRCGTSWAARSKLLMPRAVCGCAGRRGSEEARKARQRTMHTYSGRASRSNRGRWSARRHRGQVPKTLSVLIIERAACGWCRWPAGARHVGGEGRAMPEWYSSAKTLGEGVPNWKDCSRVPLRSMLQEATGGAEQ